MTHPATTRMSSKGQIVIPDQIRKQLGLKAGARFVVVGDKDVVILKNITPPSLDQFDSLIKSARKQARTARLKKADIPVIIRKVRAG